MPKSIRSVILFDLTAGWRRNVLYFMNVKRRKGKKKKKTLEVERKKWSAW